MRKLRKPLQPGTLVEVTTRTIQGRLLMVPEPTLNRSILGVLGRAQRLYPVQVHAYVFTGNHYHLLLTVDDAYQLTTFMTYLNSNLAREIAHLTGWTDKIWSRRYESIEVSGEEEIQAARMKYILAHGAKEALVARPEEWPGVHCVSPLLNGQTAVTGIWYDRTRESVLRRSRKTFTEEDYTQQETVTLTPIPCWQHLTAAVYSSQIRAVTDQITTRRVPAESSSYLYNEDCTSRGFPASAARPRRPFAIASPPKKAVRQGHGRRHSESAVSQDGKVPLLPESLILKVPP